MFYGDFRDGNEKAFLEAMETLKRLFGKMYSRDNLIALKRTAGFLTEPRFQAAFERHAETQQEKSLAWRLHTLTWAADHCLTVQGDFVECGVFRGFSSAVIADYLQFQNLDKTLYLYDTFAGIPQEFNSEHRSNQVYEQLIADDPDALFNLVRAKFATYPNVKLVRGVVPHSMAEVCPAAIAFLHIDMNSAKSEIAALEVLFDKVTPGGTIVFDDYGWSGYVKQKIAEDAFMQTRGHQILELPTGQGLVIKK